MSECFVVPAEGRTVVKPETGVALDAAGEVVPRTQFWLRRLRDGDVIERPLPEPVEDSAFED